MPTSSPARRAKTGPWRRTCRVCGRPFEATSLRSKVCPDVACQLRENPQYVRGGPWKRICRVCGRVFEATSLRAEVCPDVACQGRWNAGHVKLGPWQRTCRVCGGTFEAKVPGAEVCHAVACRRRRSNELKRAFLQRYAAEHGKSYACDRYPERLKARAQARRAAKSGAPRVEHFTSREVFERDGWICGICHEPIDRDAVWPAPGSASLDHVIPLRPPAPWLPGTHTLDNAQAAHLACNMSKGNRLTRELQPAAA